MKNEQEFYIFVYRTMIYDAGLLQLPDQWKAIAAGRYFRISSQEKGKYLFTPAAGEHITRHYLRYTDDEPSEQYLEEDLFYVTEDGCFEDGLGEGMETQNWFWVGLGNEFMLASSVSQPKIHQEHWAMQKAFNPYFSCGKAVYEAKRVLRNIHCQYNLFSIALIHPDKTVSELAAATLEDPFLLLKLAELTTGQQQNKSIHARRSPMKNIQSSRLFLERKITTLYGIDSMAMKALDLVCTEMSAERGFNRYDGTDYYMHCVDVANFLLSYGVTDQETIAAALLHDIVEDLPDYTCELIAHLFSERTAHYVDMVTKKENLDYHDGQVLQDYLNVIAGDPHAALIKTADRMHNMYSLEDASMEKRYRKAIETERFFIPFFKTCRKKYPRYEAIFQAAKTQILPQIYEIKAHYEDYCLLQQFKKQNTQS